MQTAESSSWIDGGGGAERRAEQLSGERGLDLLAEEMRGWADSVFLLVACRVGGRVEMGDGVVFSQQRRDLGGILFLAVAGGGWIRLWFPLPGELVRVCCYYCCSKPDISRLLLLYSKSL